MVHNITCVCVCVCVYLYIILYYDNDCVRNVIIACENREVISSKNAYTITHEIVFIIFLHAPRY